MQPDFMSMAQGQAAPQQAEATPETPDEMYKQLGMPTGGDDAAIQKRMMMVIDSLGLMEGLSSEGIKEMEQKVAEFVQLMKDGDMEALNAHPLSQILNKAAEELKTQAGPTAMPSAGGQVPQKGAPKDFAAMMPPTPGGGMGGR
jgi:hypothetical protein